MRTKSTGIKSERSLRIPQGDCPIGGSFTYNDVEYVVVRSEAEIPEDACCGCAFSGRDGSGYQSCPNVRCSAFDRSDGCFVWFVKADVVSD